MKPRPPIIAILGHVDHGKTTLLDQIRKSTIAKREHGGITQKIGAYEITTDIKGYKTNKITFIDTPGHEAFSALRARGANVADLAILIIDAKDSVMPQTAESISHIKAANIPFIVALNKVDLPDANTDKVKNDLLKYEVAVEGKGGHVPTIEISAKTGAGINELLETILIITSDLNLTFEEKDSPRAYIIESKKDKRGIIASVILKMGSLHIGDEIFADDKKIKVKMMISDTGEHLTVALPSTPFELLGFNEMPQVGTTITNQQITKEMIEPTSITDNKIDLDSLLHPKMLEKKLSLIIKADSQGSLEAIVNSLDKNKNVEIILKAIGDVNKSDIFLAKTTNSIVIGFSVNIFPEVVELSKQEKVIIKTYNIIYELLEELNEVADLLKEKEEKEKHLKGEAKILAQFVIEKEAIFGVKIIKGKINLADQLEVYRQNKMIGKTKLVSLKIRAKPMEEVKKDQEAGMIFSPPLDIRTGDVVKSIL